MIGRETGRQRLSWRAKGAACAAVVAASAAVVVGVAAATTPTLQSVNPTNFSHVLANSTGHSLYVLSTESATHLHCTGTCLSTWKPLEVRSSATSVSHTTAVVGKIGFVKRTSTMKQVTYNGFPVYTYTGDTTVAGSAGEAIVADGGTWYMARASAKTTGTTEVKPLLQSDSASPYTGVLAASTNRSLYLLSTEVGASIKCGAGCTSVWIPLEVSNTTTKIALGAGVKGTIGFIARSSTKDQVTFNSYPVYTYTGDSGANQSNGEGVVADGGTWYLLHASATTAGTTSVAPSSGGGGGGGW